MTSLHHDGYPYGVNTNARGGNLTGKNRLSQLESALNELQSINRTVEKVSRLRETNHIMSVIIDDLIHLTGATQGVISLLPTDRSDSPVTIIRKIQPLLADFPFHVNQLISGYVLHHKRLLRIDDLDNDDRFGPLSSDNGRFKSLLCSPMIARGEIIGLTTLLRDAGGGPFDDSHARLAGIIVSQSGQILANALLLEELAQKNELLELSQQKLHEENLQLKNRLGSTTAFENIVGKSVSMRQVLVLASKVADNDAPVLITGSTGTGKELLARAIHQASHRRQSSFVVKNCGIKTESLLEAELFGYIKGAFTGADRDHPGLFREAHSGTIFLDEIGEAPPSTQVAILRVLETGEIRPVGAGRTEFVDVRIISATNRDLRKEMANGSFREDLFYRLNTFTIELPPLSQRGDDIPLLVAHFLGKLRIKLNREDLRLSPAALAMLCAYHWPGNIRELEHELERAAIVCSAAGIIEAHDFSPFLVAAQVPCNLPILKGKMRDVVDQVEHDLIVRTLQEQKGNILRSAEVLGLTRKGLRDKITRYGISTQPKS